MAEAMTTEERWLAAPKRKQVDRLPFCPKIDASCAQHQIEPFRNMSVTDLHQWIGSDQHLGVPACVKTMRRHTSTRSKNINGTRTTEYITSAGTLTAVSRYSEGSRSWHPVEFPVKRCHDSALQTRDHQRSRRVCEALSCFQQLM